MSVKYVLTYHPADDFAAGEAPWALASKDLARTNPPHLPEGPQPPHQPRSHHHLGAWRSVERLQW